MKFDPHQMPLMYDKEKFHLARGEGKAKNFLYADGHIKNLLVVEGTIKKNDDDGRGCRPANRDPTQESVRSSASGWRWTT